jgi:hypothetical protein
MKIGKRKAKASTRRIRLKSAGGQKNEAPMSTPNTRLNALKLGVRLLMAAANPWSGMSREDAQKESWQPIDPYGWPRWWPAGALDSVSSGQARLMRRVLSLGRK